MPITYTNRKGRTYTLCRGSTKTGKPRYFFAREPKGEPVDELPDGYSISESVNGVVSLTKARPRQILPEEIAAIEAAVQRHPRSRNYRVSVRHDRIEIYELVGPDAEDLISALGRQHLGSPGLASRVRADQERYARFTPVMRFILYDEETRAFYAERWCYLGSVDDWIHVSAPDSVEEMARMLIPTLGADAFFDLY